MEAEKYVANIIEFTGGFAVNVSDEGVKPEKKKKNIQKFGYIIGETIGHGSYSKVKLCYSKKINDNVAVKIVPKKRLPEDYIDKFVPREIALLQKLEHPGKMQLIEVFETENTLYLVMEYLSRGDLLDYINSQGSLHEADARRLFRQLVDVVAFLHRNRVYHRDIKLDNILLDKNYNIRLSDFGFSRFNPQREQMHTFCGSYPYAAPEILDGENYDGAKIDVWSMGVCLYGMLNGKLPFRDTDTDVLRESMKEKIRFYKHVSSDGRKLVRSMLELDPKKRYTTNDIIHSNWMCRPISTTGPKSMSSLAVAAVTNESYRQSLDASAEHGFACAQNTKEFTPNKVSGVLQAVAVNHSTGKSSIDLKEVKMPLKKASLAAMKTGVSGPAGRRISEQLRSVPDVSAAVGKDGTNSATGKVNFNKAVKALTKFKCAVRVVTAAKRFKRGPLTTILTIPQEEAMEKIIEKRASDQLHEIKHLAYTNSGKVAEMCHNDARKVVEPKKKKPQVVEHTEKTKGEYLEKIENAFNKMGFGCTDQEETIEYDSSSSQI